MTGLTSHYLEFVYLGPYAALFYLVVNTKNDTLSGSGIIPPRN
jgi:hypothetical protein